MNDWSFCYYQENDNIAEDLEDFVNQIDSSAGPQDDTLAKRESYPYYQHEKIGYNYRMSNISAGIGRGQMTIVNDHIAHHKHVQKMYEALLKDVKGITVHSQPATGEYDSNYWLCTITLDPELKVKGQENAYKTIVRGAVGGAAGVIHVASSAVTDCQP